MELTHLIAFNLTLLVAIASPGPALLYALRATLTGGASRGLITGFGLAIMAAAWTTLALLGLEGVFALFPWAYVLLKVSGAAYLIWMAIGMWRNARAPMTQNTDLPPARRAFVTGLMVNLANPKAVLFASAVLLVIFPPQLQLWEKAMIVANHLAIELLFYSTFALLLSTPPARAGYLRLKPLIDRIAAALLGTLGLRLLIER
ncbi:LysE family transporter [Rhodobacteraceae bacterium M382]|nr:LysE family transporter [Rhodobacteraceae bacterium M382]